MRLAFLSVFLAPFVLHAEPTSLFDGKTLDGWDFDPAMWRVEDGVITGGSTTEKIKKNDFISTKKSYQNFELKLKIKVSGDPKTGRINSGIQIRSMREGTAMSGYQVDCGEGATTCLSRNFRHASRHHCRAMFARPPRRTYF